MAFSVAAASDWVWQVPVLPAAALLLAAAVLAPGPRAATQTQTEPSARAATPLAHRRDHGCDRGAGRDRHPTRDGQLGESEPVGRDDRQIGPSAGRCAHGGTPAARSRVVAAPDRAGARAPGRRDGRGAPRRRRRRADEPANWSAWLVRSRLEAESGHPPSALAAYKRGRSLNPQSPCSPHDRPAQRISDLGPRARAGGRLTIAAGARGRISRRARALPGRARPRLRPAARAAASHVACLPRAGGALLALAWRAALVADVLEHSPKLAQRPRHDLLHVGEGQPQKLCDLRTGHVAAVA